MDMTIEQMKAAVAAAESAELMAIMPAGFKARGDNSFHFGQWTLIRQPAVFSTTASTWRALKFMERCSTRIVGDGHGKTPAEAIRACKADMAAIAEWATASALELPEVAP